VTTYECGQCGAQGGEDDEGTVCQQCGRGVFEGMNNRCDYCGRESEELMQRPDLPGITKHGVYQSPFVCDECYTFERGGKTWRTKNCDQLKKRYQSVFEDDPDKADEALETAREKGCRWPRYVDDDDD
jgi:hypothetical protein